MSNRFTYLVAILLLTIMFTASLTSLWQESATKYEPVHITAGYSYLTQKDYRLNLEHPPLAKDISAIPLLTMDLNFPKSSPLWEKGTNNEWALSTDFLYNSGNYADEIIFWSRIPMLLMLLFLGGFIFSWARELAGNKAALIALFLFSFSPSFLAHGKLSTLDTAAALGAVIASYFWIKFLKKINWQNATIAGVTLGIALLFKFSLVILLPFFIITTLIFSCLKYNRNRSIVAAKGISKYLILSLFSFLVAIFLVIWPVYQLHLLDHPLEKQILDTKEISGTLPDSILNKIPQKAVNNSLLRPLGHYLLGSLMIAQDSDGSMIYFLGKVSTQTPWYYFPVIYFLKIPLAFHLITIITAIWLSSLVKNPFSKDRRKKLNKWTKSHFAELVMILFILVYWLISIVGKINIGIRHLLPTLPFLYILLSIGLSKLLDSKKEKKWIALLVFVLITWYISSSLFSWPNYISYYNEAAGGTENGYKYAVNSNYDWGQDLKRLQEWMDTNKIQSCYLDYFGGGKPEYYLGTKYKRWYGIKSGEDFPKGNYLVVSATLLQRGKGTPKENLLLTENYQWLKDSYLIPKRAACCDSLFIYFIE